MLELDFDRIILKNAGMQGKQHITAFDWIGGMPVAFLSGAIVETA
tara:strand:- start:332 stop:466 length:135 start_codon:yes stop_codon:yes gene_type:complete